MKKYNSLHGSYYPNNYGDVLILAIQARWIKEITGKDVVLPFATDVYRESIDAAPVVKFDGLSKSDKLVYGAGGYFGEPLTNKWKWGFEFFRKHFLPAEYAMMKSMEYAIIGTGVGPVTNVFTRKEVVRICKNASLISVRDIESKNYLTKYGIQENKVNVTTDVALSLTEDDLERDDIEKIDKLFNDGNKLKYGLHVGVDIDSQVYGKQVRVLIEECIKFFNENLDITPVLIIDHDNAQQNKAASYLKERIKNSCIIFKHKDIWETTAMLSRLDLVLTNKLHVGIVSYTLGTTCIGFPYHPKTIRFYKQIDQEDLCIPILELKRNKVYNILKNSLDEKWKREVENKRNKIHPKLKEKSLLNKELLESFFK